MSLSRPAKFPLLKLPYLCIRAVFKNMDLFDKIFFTLLSKRARRIVKSLNIPLNNIKIILRDEFKWIELRSCGFKKWQFRNEGKKKRFFDEHRNLRKYPLVLQNNASPLYTSKTDFSLESYAGEHEIPALKMAMKFLDEVFKCSVKNFDIYGDNFPETGDIGVKSTENFSFRYQNRQPFNETRNQKLNLLLESLQVTGTCSFWVTNTENDFYCDPKLFKCRKLVFWLGSAAWVTREILIQFEVPRLHFYNCQLPVENIVSFVNNWFHSDNKKLEYLYIRCKYTRIYLNSFRDWNALPFKERTRVPSSETFRTIDFSKGLEIVRHDGLQATIHVKRRKFLFYVWNNQ